MNKQNSRKGFSIVDIIIVIALIATLSTMLLPTFENIIADAENAAAMQEAKNMYTQYLIDNNGKAAEFMIYEMDDLFVALHNGGVIDVCSSKESALKAMLPGGNANLLKKIGDGKMWTYTGNADEALTPAVELVESTKGYYIQKNSLENTNMDAYTINKYSVTPGIKVLIQARIGDDACCVWVDSKGSRTLAIVGNDGAEVNTNQTITVPETAVFLEVSFSDNWGCYVIESSIIAGMKIGLLGDSIAQNGGFLSTFVNQTGASSSKNVAIGGWSYAEDTGLNNEYPADASTGIYRQAANLDGDEDIIIIWAGTNDFGHSHKIGTMFDSNGQINLDVTTFYGGINRTIEDVREKVGENVPIIICSPLHRNMPIESDPNYPYSSTSANKLGYNFENYLAAITAVAEHYNLLLFDSNAETGLDPNVKDINSKYFSDGLHPNADGHKIIGNELAQFVKENFNQ